MPPTKEAKDYTQHGIDTRHVGHAHSSAYQSITRTCSLKGMNEHADMRRFTSGNADFGNLVRVPDCSSF